MIQSKFKIGDKVMVINVRDCYRYYDVMAELMGLTNWNEDVIPDKNSKAIIINIEQHPEQNTLVIGIKTKDGKEYMMGEEGIKLLKPSKSDNPILDVIQISRDTLNYYYENATESQRTYINNNFKIDGTTTVKALIGLEELACDAWKPVIRNNHPEYFLKVFDFSTYAEKYGSHIFTPEEYEALGFDESPIQIRNFGEYKHKAFYLTSRNDVKWEIKEENCGGQVLVPIFK